MSKDKAHESWCDTIHKLSLRCNCIVSEYIEEIETLEAKLAECVAEKLDLNLKKTALLASLIRAVECLESVQASTNHPTTIMFIGETLDAIKQRHGEL